MMNQDEDSTEMCCDRYLETPGVSNNTTGTLEQKKTNSWTPVDNGPGDSEGVNMKPQRQRSLWQWFCQYETTETADMVIVRASVWNHWDCGPGDWFCQYETTERADMVIVRASVWNHRDCGPGDWFCQYETTTETEDIVIVPIWNHRDCGPRDSDCANMKPETADMVIEIVSIWSHRDRGHCDSKGVNMKPQRQRT